MGVGGRDSLKRLHRKDDVLKDIYHQNGIGEAWKEGEKGDKGIVNVLQTVQPEPLHLF